MTVRLHPTSITFKKAKNILVPMGSLKRRMGEVFCMAFCCPTLCFTQAIMQRARWTSRMPLCLVFAKQSVAMGDHLCKLLWRPRSSWEANRAWLLQSWLYLVSCVLKVWPLRGWYITEGFPISMVLATLDHLKELLGIVENITWHPHCNLRVFPWVSKCYKDKQSTLETDICEPCKHPNYSRI